jgi:hypothetical protein
MGKMGQDGREEAAGMSPRSLYFYWRTALQQVTSSKPIGLLSFSFH